MNDLADPAVMAANPIVAEVTRGRSVESYHRGRAVVADASGGVVAQWGDADQPTIPRSALKPLQALAMVETGAADKVALTTEELAIACASHSGAARHVAVVGAWLERLGLGEEDLVCGGHAPVDRAAREKLIAAGRKPSRLHDNCSGKHAAMLTLARFLKAPAAGYAKPDHPVQKRIRALIGEVTGVGSAPAVTDGCGVPSYTMPLSALAVGIARFASGAELSGARAAAARRLVAAMATAPDMIGGPERFDAAANKAGAGALIVKGGAEGVLVAAVPDRQLGFAVKIDDGGARATEVVIMDLLARYAGLPAGTMANLAAFAAPPVRTRRGARVGVIRAVLTP